MIINLNVAGRFHALPAKAESLNRRQRDDLPEEPREHHPARGTNLPMALNVADVTHVLNRGRIVYSSVPQALWENGGIKSRYLGL